MGATLLGGGAGREGILHAMPLGPSSPPSPDRAPLVRLFAPSGTGKTSVVPHLAGPVRGRAVVADLDEILEDGGLLGVRVADPAASAVWPAYDRLWERIAGLVTRAGVPMILRGQVPDAGDAGAWATGWGWEIPAAERAARLRARGASAALVADAAADAEVLRTGLRPGRLLRSPAEESPEHAAVRIWSALAGTGGDLDPRA